MTDETKWILESVSARLERTIKRLWVLCIILLLSLIISNACWIYYESQWQYVTTETEIEQDVKQETEGGDNSFIGGDYYGSETDSTYDSTK